MNPRPQVSVTDLTECSTEEGGNNAQFVLTDAIASASAGTAAYFSGTNDITANRNDYTGTDNELITVKYTDGDCVTSKSFTLNVNPRPQVSVTDLTECSTEEGGEQRSVCSY